jgi:predicted Zn-ribbon and HTH transcriptional regulator
MPTHKEHILRILSEAEPLSTSEIADRLNRGLGPAGVYTSLEIVARLKRISDL